MKNFTYLLLLVVFGLNTNSLKAFEISNERAELLSMICIQIDSVTAEKIGGDENEHIVDYALINENTRVQISKIKKQYFFKVFKNGSKVETRPISFEVKRIHQDVEGNIYLLTEDKAVKISLEDPTKLFAFESLSVFENTIKNVISKTDSTVILEYVDTKNADFGLVEMKQDMYKKVLIFQHVSKSNEIVTKKWRIGERSIYDETMQARNYNNESSNVPVSEMASNSRRNTQARPIYTYKRKSNPNVNALFPSNVKYVHSDTLVYGFDMEGGKVFTLNLLNDSVTEKKIELHHGLDGTILYDEITKTCFQSVYEKGILSIYKIDLQNDQVTNQLKLTGQSFVENVRIYNGSLYYTKQNEAGFGKLYKVVL